MTEHRAMKSTAARWARNLAIGLLGIRCLACLAAVVQSIDVGHAAKALVRRDDKALPR